MTSAKSEKAVVKELAKSKEKGMRTKMIIRDLKKNKLRVNSGGKEGDMDVGIVDGDLNELARLEEVQYQVEAAQHDNWQNKVLEMHRKMFE